MCDHCNTVGKIEFSPDNVKYPICPHCGTLRIIAGESCCEKVIEEWHASIAEPDSITTVSHDPINFPVHYTSSKAKCTCGRTIECIDITRHLNSNLGNAVKYIWRCDLKEDAIKDLKKSITYLNDEIQRRIE